jgi:PAS domain S-box-containing protein
LTGKLLENEIERILETIPIEISFIDRDGHVKYYNKEGKRIFPRKGSIGNHVEQCHPQKSIEMVRTIIDDFTSGNSDHAKFWFHVGDKMVFVRYFAVRDKENNYLGTVEVTEDITMIQKLQGEKRTLKGINFDV